MSITRREVTIPLPDGVQIASWLYVLDGEGPFPTITMAHGLGGTRQQRLEPIAEKFPNSRIRRVAAGSPQVWGQRRYAPVPHSPVAAN